MGEGNLDEVSSFQSDRKEKEDLRRSQLLDTEASEPLTHVDALLEGLALDDTSGETTGECVTAR